MITRFIQQCRFLTVALLICFVKCQNILIFQEVDELASCPSSQIHSLVLCNRSTIISQLQFNRSRDFFLTSTYYFIKKGNESTYKWICFIVSTFWLRKSFQSFSELISISLSFSSITSSKNSGSFVIDFSRSLSKSSRDTPESDRRYLPLAIGSDKVDSALFINEEYSWLRSCCSCKKIHSQSEL